MLTVRLWPRLPNGRSCGITQAFVCPHPITGSALNRIARFKLEGRFHVPALVGVMLDHNLYSDEYCLPALGAPHCLFLPFFGDMNDSGNRILPSPARRESCPERALLGAAWRIRVVTDITDLRSALEPV